MEASIVPAPGSNPGVSLDADPISLRAAFDQDEANHRAAQYRIDDDGVIRVTPGAIGPLTTIEEISLELSEAITEQLFEKD